MAHDFDIDAVLDAVVAQAGVDAQAKRIAEYHKDRRKYVKAKSFSYYAGAKTTANIKKYDNNLAIAQTMRQADKADAIAKFRPDNRMSKERCHSEFIFAQIFKL